MPKFLVRCNVEYSIEINAESEEDAIDKAPQLAFNNIDYDYCITSSWEADETYED